jgi:alcohol dehydrogenase class IV
VSTAFELAAPARIVFGAGSAAQIPAIARGFGTRPLLVGGSSPARLAPLDAALRREGLTPLLVAVASEPTVAMVRDAAAQARDAACDVVIACGGGSALDAGKAIAALVGNGGDPLDYLEVIGRGRKLERPSLPFVAIPTTAGTGAEVTRNAVLAAPEAGVKASLRSPLMLPALAIVDPDLLSGSPPAVLAASGLDALSQLIEPFLSSRANPITDALAREGIRRSARSLARVVTETPDAAAREDLALASLMGGLCLANAGLGAVHGFAAPLGGMFAAPHGALCAALLVPVLEVNLRALQARAPEHPALGRFQELAALVTGAPGASVAEGLARLRALVSALEIPGLAHHGLTAEAIPLLVSRARAASSMKANPVALSDEELSEIARAAL